jgi:hypothetical protein
MWPHFETVHILQQPTYMSMYPPAQGLVLALGEKIAGQAWAGVWLSALLMSGVICWMLQGWMSPPWALLGGLLTIIRWGLFSYWVNSYWGGAVPAIGGALVIGSLPRLLRWGRLLDSLALGSGLALLANSRPYEGLIFSVTVCIAFVAWTAGRHLWARISRLRIAVPLSVLIGLTAGGSLYYNWRITGVALRLPYELDREQYGIAPLFLFLKLNTEPHYETASLRRVYEAEVKLYEKGRSRAGIPEALRKLKDFWIFYFGPLLTIPMLGLWLPPSFSEDQRTKLFMVVLAGTLGAVLLEVWFYPHYASPAMAVIIALVLRGMRRLRSWRWRGKPSGLFLTRAIPIGCLLVGFLPAIAATLDLHLEYWPLQWYGGNPDVVRPASLTAPLNASDRQALILVRYGASHDVGEEWVYNEPDIDKAPIVWAREIDASHDAALVRYFANRGVWLFEPDKHPWRLQPYSLKAQRTTPTASP